MSGTQDDPMDGNNSDGRVDDPSSQPNAGSSEASAGKEQTDQPCQFQPSPQEGWPTARQSRSNKRHSDGLSSTTTDASRFCQGEPPGYSLLEGCRESSSELSEAGPDSMQESIVGQGTAATDRRRPCPHEHRPSDNSDDDLSSQSSGGSSEDRAGKMPKAPLSESQLSTQGNGPTVLQSRRNEQHFGGGSSVDETESSQELKRKNEVRAAEIKRARKELKPVLQPRYLEYAERWMEENGVEPKELLEFVKSLQKETKPSAYSYISSWNPLSRFTTVTLSSVVTGQTFGAHQVIISQLKIRQLRVTELTPKNQHQCESIILFCPITSRAGSDVEAAMRNPAVAATDKRIFLVLLYHTRDVDYSTARKSCTEKFPRVLFEFHVLFHETQNGLLRCEQNSQAIRELREAICAQFGIS
ncbi:uncharacterized protein LOC115384474 isoform X1 [Salarias fasciatus]|uniref:uncharacterized protein LOC115384474 isoform X1 n=1 Tax=Salarias fasciatus TaxID=181472 RepID=UPI001176947B|nr:uncharacterized protein LOC115384474 isoform X1 [Salarias fasciatus]